jgi:hypothetical protein
VQGLSLNGFYSSSSTLRIKCSQQEEVAVHWNAKPSQQHVVLGMRLPEVENVVYLFLLVRPPVITSILSPTHLQCRCGEEIGGRAPVLIFSNHAAEKARASPFQAKLEINL